jgi:hypothetical protein
MTSIQNITLPVHNAAGGSGGDDDDDDDDDLIGKIEVTAIQNLWML